MRFLIRAVSSTGRYFLIVGIVFAVSVNASVSFAAELDRSICFDASAIPSNRIIACTQIIDGSETSDQVRLAAYLSRAAASYLAGEFGNAIQDYSAIIRAQPGNATAYHERGLAYLKESQFPRAIADFSEAIHLNLNYANAFNNRGTVYAKLKDYEKALADFNAALRINPLYSAALYNRSLVYCDRNEYELAITDLKHAIEIDPDKSDSYNQLAWVYLKIGSPSIGLQFANRALEIRPSANAYDTRGAIYEKTGEVNQAIDDYRRALILDPSLISSDQALTRLLENSGVSHGNTVVAALIFVLMQLVEKNGWRVDLGRMCSEMKLDSQRDCMFKQISVSSDVPDVTESNGFNVPQGNSPQYVVIYSFEPLVGNFFVVSLSGTLKSAFFRAKGIDYTEVPLADARRAFEKSIKFWNVNLETLKRMPAGDGPKR